MRDVGIVSFLNDISCGIIAVGLSIKSPRYLKDFVDANKKVCVLYYGVKYSPYKFIEVITHSDSMRERNESQPVLIFVHGGAWGSGRPYQYRLSACGIGSAIEARAVVVVGYPYYPEASILQQRDSLLEAINFIKSNPSVQELLGNSNRENGGRETIYVLSGHSSGANLCALSQLATEVDPQVDVIIALSGVYDITDHYRFEAGRRVHEISPMKAAAGDLLGFPRCSPTQILLDMTMATTIETFGSNTSYLRQPISFPYTIILHGSEDDVVPLSSSERFARALVGAGVRCDMVIPPVSISLFSIQ
jgi:acetyl esterase/lipase